MKKIQQILVHLRIYYLSSAVEISYNEAIEEILTLIEDQYDPRKTLPMTP